MDYLAKVVGVGDFGKDVVTVFTADNRAMAKARLSHHYSGAKVLVRLLRKRDFNASGILEACYIPSLY